MLLYYNGNYSRLLFQCLGSVFWRASTLSVGFGVALVTVGLQVNLDSETVFNTTLPHQWPMQTLGVIITVAIVFRTNQAWQRYWEGVTQLHLMYSKWADAFSQFCGFVSVTIMKAMENERSHEENIAKLRDMHEKVQNDFLLLSAMACDRICRGDCAQMARRSKLGAAWADRIVLRENLRYGFDDTDGEGMPSFRKAGINHLKASCVERHDDAIIQGTWDAEYPVLKPPTGSKYELLLNSYDRANMVVNWLNHNLALCSTDLSVAPPIQSRMYQEISNGMLGFNNAVKVADVPLALPYAQVIIILMALWNMLIPFYVVSFTKSIIAGPVMAFLLSSFIFCLNGIAAELENPFGPGPNSICVPEFHSRFLLVITDACRSCYYPPRPPKSHTVVNASSILWAYEGSRNSSQEADTPDGETRTTHGLVDISALRSMSKHPSEAAGAQDMHASVSRLTLDLSAPTITSKQQMSLPVKGLGIQDESHAESLEAASRELMEVVDTIGIDDADALQFVDILAIASRTSQIKSMKHRFQAQADMGARQHSVISGVRETPEEEHTRRQLDTSAFEHHNQPTSSQDAGGSAKDHHL